MRICAVFLHRCISFVWTDRGKSVICWITRSRSSLPSPITTIMLACWLHTLEDWARSVRRKLSQRRSPPIFLFDTSNSGFPPRGPRSTNEEITAHASSCVVQIESDDAGNNCTAIALGGGSELCNVLTELVSSHRTKFTGHHARLER